MIPLPGLEGLPDIGEDAPVPAVPKFGLDVPGAGPTAAPPVVPTPVDGVLLLAPPDPPPLDPPPLAPCANAAADTRIAAAATVERQKYFIASLLLPPRTLSATQMNSSVVAVETEACRAWNPKAFCTFWLWVV
jgi:hypothetical protein